MGQESIPNINENNFPLSCNNIFIISFITKYFSKESRNDNSEFFHICKKSKINFDKNNKRWDYLLSNICCMIILFFSSNSMRIIIGMIWMKFLFCWTWSYWFDWLLVWTRMEKPKSNFFRERLTRIAWKMLVKYFNTKFFLQ